MTLHDAAETATILQLLLAIAVAAGGSVLLFQYMRSMKPVWKRFSENIKREVAVISTEKQTMEPEANILSQVGFFKIKHVSADIKNLNLLQGAELLVVGYSPRSKIYSEVLKYAIANRQPIIVFSGRHRLSDTDRAELKDYSYSSICETDLRLVSDVFAAISTFPELK